MKPGWTAALGWQAVFGASGDLEIEVNGAAGED